MRYTTLISLSFVGKTLRNMDLKTPFIFIDLYSITHVILTASVGPTRSDAFRAIQLNIEFYTHSENLNRG